MSFRRDVTSVARQYGLPSSLVVAFAQALSGGIGESRYDPNWDATRIQPIAVWREHPEWLGDGPTAHDWFVYHPESAPQRCAGRDYSFVAQEQLAGRYGPFLLYYVEALEAGWLAAPQELVTELEMPIALLRDEVDWAAERCGDELDALRVAIARFNGHHAGNHDPDHLENHGLIEAVEYTHRQLYGRAFWRMV